MMPPLSTMSKLHLADDLSLPLDACTQTFAWIGRKGSGKTYGSGKLVEELLRASVQTVSTQQVERIRALEAELNRMREETA